ncbi:hypothetical protein [Nitrosomonas communis]|uniref:Uncharacterized protein n=1 Tax=Nitrosomonas communis TaxID=44574 RepID=A0A1H2TL80_9PROT|nr:hypothetical protein [Nitrosomonas communis]SDW43999.1 hypothetical protein SAMN05421882_101144 [Nitrosomonas communis]
METFNFWNYLDNIWVLTGLILVIAVSLLKMLSVNNQNSRKSKQQLQKGINYLFVLSITGMALSILFSQNSSQTTPQQTSLSFPTQDAIDHRSPQSFGSDTDNAVNTGDNMNFNQLFNIMPDRVRSERPKTTDQQKKDDNSVITSDDEKDFR